MHGAVLLLTLAVAVSASITAQRPARADLLLLDGNPLENIRNAARIHAVVTAGRAHTRAALDRLLDGARTAAK